jgi:hypothetical protein
MRGIRWEMRGYNCKKGTGFNLLLSGMAARITGKDTENF